MNAVLVIIVGLAISFALALVVVLLVALPGLRAEGRLKYSSDVQRFRLPVEWTGYDDEVHEFFGHDDGTSHLATREQAAVTAIRDHSYVLRPQPRRHAAPSLITVRPRTRHWKIPESGTGWRTTAGLLFGSRGSCPVTIRAPSVRDPPQRGPRRLNPACEPTRRHQPGGIRELECHRPARGCAKEGGRTMDQPIILLVVAAVVFILVVALDVSLRVNAQKKGLRDKHSIDADVTGELSIDEVTEAVEEEKAEVRGSEVPTEPAGRLVRLRERLAKSNTGLGRGLLNLLSRDNLDESTWEEIEDTLILADVGVDPTTELVDRLRERVKVLGTRDPEEVRGLLREELITLVDPTMARSLAATGAGDDPAVILVVGVNGSGKTTTVGKIARVLVAEDKTVLLGAADTFRAAAAEQLATWGDREIGRAHV